MASKSTERKLRVIVADDEPGARRRLIRLLKNESDIDLVGEAANGKEVLKLIQAHAPDLIFLDVQMPGKSGIEVAVEMSANPTMQASPAVVFVTAYDQYAVKAFDLAAIDYLLKPFDDERFEQALSRVRKSIQKEGDGKAELAAQLSAFLSSYDAKATPTKPAYMERIAVDVRGQLHIIPVEKISFIEASGNYVYLHAGEDKWLVREKMQILEDRLNPEHFFRIHRSTIVRMDEIDRLFYKAGGNYSVRLHSGKQLKVSRGRWGELALRLGIQTPTGEGSA